LRKTLWVNDSEPIIVIMAILLVLGTINVFSSSFVLAVTEYEDPFYFLRKHVILVLVGLLFFVGCRHIAYEHWRVMMLPLLIFIIGSLVAVLVFSDPVNGAKRWLGVGAFKFQPAEFAKLISLMLMAAFLANCLQRRRLSALNVVFSLQMGLILLMAFLVYKEPDMGTAVIIAGVPLLMAMVTVMTKHQIVGLACMSPFLLGGLAVLQPYRLQRLLTTWDPWQDAQGVGYQTVQSLATIGSGGFTGMGFGAGVSKYQYLPEAHTDFAFAIFCQEHGYLGALMAFVLYLALMVYCVRVANMARDLFGQILATGIMLLIVGQAVINMLMVGGMFPVVGVPLPFISYGGSSLVVTMSAMGMLTNIADHCVHPAQRPKPAPQAPAKPQRAQLRVVPGGQSTDN